MPKPQRTNPAEPRARLIAHGAEALTDGELIAVVLRHKSRAKRHDDAVQKANGLHALLSLDREALAQRGFDESHTAILSAVAELSRRQARQKLTDRFTTTRPEEVAPYLRLRYYKPDQEVLGALFVDMKNQVLDEMEAFRGTLTRASVEPRCLMRRALTIHACGLILFHTHPGGHPDPSTDDIRFTHRVAEAGLLLGVKLIDHIILGDEGTYVSLKKRGIVSNSFKKP